MKMFIGFVQKKKRVFVNQVVKDEDLKTLAHNYIDSQTAFANMLVDNTTGVMKNLFDNYAKCWRKET